MRNRSILSALILAGVSLFPLLLLPVVRVPAVTAEIFYVSPAGDDSNSGTEGAPWKTIGKAAAALVAGDTAIVMDGTFTEPEVVFRNSGTATMPITLRAQHQHQAVLSSTSGCHPNISIYASYVTIEDLRSVIASHNVSCAAHNSADGDAVRCWDTDSANVAARSPRYVGCVVRGMLIIDGSPARSVAVKTSQDFALLENIVAYSGLEAFNSYGVIFRNNTIIGGDAWGSSVTAKGGVRNFQAYNNVVRVRAVSGQGLLLGGSTDSRFLFDPPSGLEAYNSVAFNNVVINESGGPAEALGIMGAKDSALFNNVVIQGTLVVRPGNTSTESINPTIKNNIFVCSGGHAAGPFSYSGQLSFDHNNFHNCANVPPQAVPITGDPLFVDVQSDWHLAPGSPARQRGTPVRMTGFKGENLFVNKDKDGKVRAVPWDLGIYAMNDTGDSTPPAPPTNIRVS